MMAAAALKKASKKHRLRRFTAVSRGPLDAGVRYVFGDQCTHSSTDHLNSSFSK